MKYLHIWPNEKFTTPYIKFINENFDKEEHLFIIVGEGNEIYQDGNVIEVKGNLRGTLNIINNIYQYEQVYLHSLFTPKIIKILFLQPWLLKKCRWIIWGGDLYQYRTSKNTFTDKLYETLRKVIIRKMGYIISLVKGDYVLAQKWYKTKAKNLNGRYINPISYEYLDNLPIINEKREVFIQIGNSGDSSNLHLEALDLLKGFAEENIKIFMPLSYGGTEDYKNSVIKHGKKIYGEKFVPMLDFLSPDAYGAYLSSIDIALFNNNRQQALGNIYALLYLEKKVFIKSDTTMWDSISDELGLGVYEINTLTELTFGQFIEKQDNENKEIIKKITGKQELIKIWKGIFEA